MEIIINKSLMIPIYTQIVESIKKQIRNGELVENDNLPSVRSLSRDLQISALTVKKAYDCLEEEGFIKTIHGKGSYICINNIDLLLDEQKEEIQKDFNKTIQKGKLYGLSKNEIKKLFDIVLRNK